MNGEYREAGYIETVPVEYPPAEYPPAEYVDIVYLTDGRTIIGKIVEETAETITIRIDSEEITISREDIQNIRRSVVVPIGEIVPWLKKYGPWILAGTALVFSAIALSRK